MYFVKEIRLWPVQGLLVRASFFFFFQVKNKKDFPKIMHKRTLKKKFETIFHFYFSYYKMSETYFETIASISQN